MVSVPPVENHMTDGCALDIWILAILAAKTKFQSGKAAENSGCGFAEHIQLTNMFR